MNVIAITGVSGFIGEYLVDLLACRSDIQIRGFIHKSRSKGIFDKKNVIMVEGDLMKPETLEGFIVPGCTVVNLAYFGDGSRQENLGATDNLAGACARAKIKRFIHCSTAVVAGKVPDNVIDENTKCNPATEYEITKLAVEKMLLDKYSSSFEVVVLRPTTVFGPGGKNLIKLANDLRQGNRILNYLKSCLFDYRKMNLVHIENVVSSIEFLIDTEKAMDQEIFIVSDDDSPINNYRDIEKYLIKRLGYKDYLLSRFSLPKIVLSTVLKLAGKSNVNPKRVYYARKLMNAGFKKSVSFEEGLASFADWYKKQFVSSSTANP
jgi:nucleoside-diphosphate-sugar epimerase